MRKSQNNNKHFFYFYFFIKKNLYFVRKYIWKSLIYIVNLYYSFFCVEGSCKYGNKTPTFTKICIGLVDAVLLPKIFGNRLDILTQILMANRFYIYIFQRSTFNLEKKQKHWIRKIFDSTPYKKPDLLTAELFFRLIISQRYVHNLETNWKNFLCIGVKNFANL